MTWLNENFFPLLDFRAHPFSDPASINEHMFMSPVIANSSGRKSSGPLNALNLSECSGISIVPAFRITPLTS